MMEPWLPSPLSALEVEARRAAAEEGKFPPVDPAVMQYSQNGDYDFQRGFSRSSSPSSDGGPPSYPKNRQASLPSQCSSAPQALPHTTPNFPNYLLPPSDHDREYYSHQAQWNHEYHGHHPTQASTHSVSHNHSMHELSWKKRPSQATQSRPLVNTQCHIGYSPSSSPSHNQTFFGPISVQPSNYPARYTFINQVFKPLYIGQDEKEMKLTNSCQFVRNDGGSRLATLAPAMKFESGNTRHLRAELEKRSLGTGGKKSKRPNEKRFPCPDCGRMFARAFNMETHRKTHIGYRPHHCPKCEKNFSRRHDLHRHLAAVHNDQSKRPLQNSTATPSPQAKPQAESGNIISSDNREAIQC